MTLENWNWKLPVELQDVPWDCAAASLTWCLNTIGRAVTEAEVVQGLGPTRISPAYGLLDASGAGIVDYLATIGIVAQNDAEATWDEMYFSAGFQPMLMGGREWCHWTGVRMSPMALERPDIDAIALANPAPGYRGVYQVIDRADFDALGTFSAVWFVGW